MTLCERCGKEMPDTAAICPTCGTASSISRPGPIAPTGEGQNPPSSPSSYYAQGYSQQYNQVPLYPQPQPGYAQQQQQQPGYNQPYQVPPAMYQPVSVNINMQAPIVPVASSGNSGATVVEVLLTIFLGIYGIGWLMAGETTTGIILLICSFLIYWPIMILGTIFTLGIGLACLVPLAIGAIILNAILLSNTIKRKTSYILVQPMQVYPPQ
jgi:hypothetical protein